MKIRSLKLYWFIFLSWRWEEERYPEGIKWKFLEHSGPVFAPPYEPLPENVKFYYDGKLICFHLLGREINILRVLWWCSGDWRDEVFLF